MHPIPPISSFLHICHHLCCLITPQTNKQTTMAATNLTMEAAVFSQPALLVNIAMTLVWFDDSGFCHTTNIKSSLGLKQLLQKKSCI
jgi:hypothetical protein